MKIFIADDETPVRQWLKFCIERSKEPYEIVGEASNGKEALEKLAELKPDAVILDIMMPGFTGLEILPRLKQLYPEVSIIMLTNFAEFEYIRNSVRQGAEEYFLKSEITEEDLLACLKRIAVKRERGERAKAMDNEVDCSTLYRLSEMILKGTVNTKAEFLRAAKNFPPPIVFKNNLTVIAIKHTRGNPIEIPTAVNEMSNYLSTMYHILCSENISLLILEMAKLTSRLMIYNAIGDIISWIKKNLTFQYIGISNVYMGFEDFYNGVTESISSMHYGFYKIPGSVIFVWDIEEQKIDQGFLNACNRDIIEMSQQDRYNEMLVKISLIFEYFQKKPPADPNFVINYFVELTYIIWTVYMTKSIHFDVQDKEFRLGIRHEYFDCDYLFELEELVNKRIQSFCEKSKNDKIYSPPVADSIKYIREHYCENLSLGKIAQHVHMNTDYLGKLFKKETGVSFNTFITEIKMEYADYLIRNTNLKKYEVSEKLGYTNFSYFSRLYSNYKAQKKL